MKWVFATTILLVVLAMVAAFGVPDVDMDAWAVRDEDGSWLLEGHMPIPELKARLDIDAFPDEDRGRYNTLAGLLMAESGHLPGVGERITCAGKVVEKLERAGRRCVRPPPDVRGRGAWRAAPVRSRGASPLPA